MSKEMVKEMVCNDSMNAGGAVGVSNKCWFVAIVNNNSEKRYGEKLQKMGFESYVPTQKEVRRWRNGKVKTIERVILSAVVFIHSTETERREIVKLPFVKRFMTNNALKEDKYQKHPIAIIPEYQMQQLRFMLENAGSPVSIEALPLRLGDKIVVNKGKLQGFEGNIINCNEGDIYIVVCLDFLGCAKMRISLDDVERI